MYHSIGLCLLLSLAAGALAQQGGSCPEAYGVQTYPSENSCDRFYKCTNGTLTEEICENGLAYDGHGNVHNHCNYNWAVDCGKARSYDDTPISSPGCLYQFGIYPVGKGCQTTFFKCAHGTAYETACKRGQAYSNEYHLCDYPDNVQDCDSESVIGFKCPGTHELPPNAVARRFLPYPRFPLPDDKYAYIVCVYDKPRIQYCGEYSYFDDQTLSCVYEEELAPHQAQAPHFRG
jgi:hypothetical protein